MRITKIQILILLSLCLLSPALTRVGKIKNINDAAITKNATLAIDFNEHFDFSRVKNMSQLKFTVTQNHPEGEPKEVGRVFTGINEPFASYQYNKTAIEKSLFTKYIDERSFVIFTDDGKVVYEETAANGFPRNIEHPKVFNLAFYGPKVSCQDAIPWGDSKELIVIACISKNVQASSNTIWIQIIDRKTFTKHSEVKTYELSQDSDFRIFNHMKLLEVWSSTKAGKVVPYLLLTDMGKSNQQTNKDSIIIIDDDDDNDLVKDNTHFLAFDLHEDQFEFNQEFKMSAGGNNTFARIYDYYWYNDELVVTSKLKGKEPIQISQCKFQIPESKKKNDIATIDCDGVAAPTGINIGYVSQLVGSQLWAKIDLSGSTGLLNVEVFNANNQISNPQVWTILNSKKGVKLPSDSEHKWVRRVQGNAEIISIQYTSLEDTTIPSATKDSDASVVHFGTGSSQTFPGWSANVHNRNVYYFVVGSNHFAVARVSGAWWMAKGTEISDRVDNVINFSVVDPNNSSITLSSSIYQTTGGKDVKLVWDPPYLDIHQNSFMTIPFNFNSYKVGNNLDFIVQFSDDNFHGTTIMHSHQVAASFNTTDTNFSSIQFVTGHGAATVTYGGKMFIYDCDVDHGKADCEPINTAAIDIKGKITEVLPESAFGSNSVQAYTNTYAEGGVRKEGQTFVYYNFKGTKQIYTQKVEFSANNVAFTSDSDGNLWAALSYLANDSDTVHTQVVIYKVDHTKPSEWTLVKTLNSSVLEIDDPKEFCPTQVEFDPVTTGNLHILSNCHLKGYLYTATKIYTFNVEAKPDVAVKASVSFDINTTSEFQGVAQFCPFNENFVVYSTQANKVIVIEKKQSLSYSTVSLGDYGLETFESFDCMSNAGLYAVGGKIQGANGPKYNYGIFWGNVGFDESKFVNKLFKDVDPTKFQDARSFGVGPFCLTVGFSTDEKSVHTSYTVQQTLSEPPIMFTMTNDLAHQSEYEQTGFLNITATNDWVKFPVSANITTVKQNMTVAAVEKQAWKKESGWIQVEQYTKLTGPITEIVAKNAEGQTKGIQFIDRKKRAGQMKLDNNKVVFSEYRGSVDHGMALSWHHEKEYSTFSLIDDGKITSQFEVPRTLTMDFTSLKQEKTKKLVVATMATSNGEEVHAFTVDDGSKQVTISEKTTGTRADKLRIITIIGKYIAFGLDSNTNTLTAWEITDTDGKLVFEVVDQTSGVTDFDIAHSSTEIFVYYIAPESPAAYFYSLTPTNHGIDVSGITTLPFDTKKPYWLESISCQNSTVESQAICAVNTIGTVIYVVDIVFPKNRADKIRWMRTPRAIKYETYEKFAGFDGHTMFVDEDFLVHRAFSLKSGSLSLVANVYARDYKKAQLHTQIQINQGQADEKLFRRMRASGKSYLQIERKLMAANKEFGTMAMTYFFENDRGIVGIGSNDATVGLLLFSLHNSFQVFHPADSNVDFTKWTIVPNGLAISQGFNLEQMLDNDIPSSSSASSGSSGSESGSETGSGSEGSSGVDPSEDTKKNAAWWVFLGILLILVILSVGWFAYARSKSSDDYEDDEGIYRSIDPTSKVEAGNEFETGLNPDEDEDDALN